MSLPSSDASRYTERSISAPATSCVSVAISNGSSQKLLFESLAYPSPFMVNPVPIHAFPSQQNPTFKKLFPNQQNLSMLPSTITSDYRRCTTVPLSTSTPLNLFSTHLSNNLICIPSYYFDRVAPQLLVPPSICIPEPTQHFYQAGLVAQSACSNRADLSLPHFYHLLTVNPHPCHLLNG